MTNYGPILFTGTAEFYVKYRPAYPSKIFADIVSYFSLKGHGQLLDLGCGTGELAIPLSKHFDRVLALDPELEMLNQGKLKAKANGISNINWQNGSSESLKSVKGVFKLITIGQAFHWMDRKRVLDDIYNLIESSGGLFIAGAPNSMNMPQNSLTTRKDNLIKELLVKYIGPGRRAGNSFYQPSKLNWEKDLFPNSKFSKFERRQYDTKVTRNVDQELGNLYSMSWARREYFGKNINEFEAEFKQNLALIVDNNKFINRVVFEAYFLSK
jgi:ubiquinone/menaquinone biosynthesis C-methylase UbiE